MLENDTPSEALDRNYFTRALMQLSEDNAALAKENTTLKEQVRGLKERLRTARIEERQANWADALFGIKRRRRPRRAVIRSFFCEDQDNFDALTLNHIIRPPSPHAQSRPPRAPTLPEQP